MSRINCSSLLVAIGLALCAGLTSCKDDDLASDDHYKAPDWLKGNAYEVLQQDGNYNIFLRAIDLSDYHDIVAGKSILTVIAPSDDAFRTFLSQKGYGSIDELNDQDHAYLNKLVGYHLMYYAFDWSKMVNFRPSEGDGASAEQKEVGAGYYYKHRTHCSDPIEQARVKLTAEASTDTLISIYHYERYIPVLSNKLFETKGIDAAYNYNYFFPDTEWGGTTLAGTTFNIANAKVLDASSVVTDNGYLYHVDHVIEPLNTIYDEMKLNPNYSKFLSLYNQFSTYELADDEVSTSLGYQVYLHSHGDLPPIAWEWPAKSWKSMSILEMAGYNVFAPTNAAIDNFFNNFWTAEGGYTSVEDLDPLIIQYFVNQSFSDDRFLVFPEEIKRGDVKTLYGTTVNIDPDQVTDRRLCANGIFYGMDHMDMPAIFSSVVGPAFQDTKYRAYLYALDKSAGMLSLASKGTTFVTLMPTEEQMNNTEPAIRLYSTTLGKQLQQYSSDQGDFVEMGSNALKNITDMHVAQNVSELKTTGTQVISTNAPYNYWFVKDGKITTNALFNEQLSPLYTGDPFVAFHPLKNDGHAWDNGSSYSYDATALFERASGDGLGHFLAVCNDKNYPYYMFAQLLQKCGLIVNGGLSGTIAGVDIRFIAFAPTNQAIIDNLASIPGASALKVVDGELTGSLSATNKTTVAKYMSQYFVNSLMNPFTDYPFVGSSCKGEFYTAGSNKLNIIDDGSKLSVGFVGGDKIVNVIPDYSYLPFAYSDGCMHFIDGIL
ncbi:MAG: fasciclin [Duncaniella sp.]|nr:fasciclin [Duncaniella sp.]